jgi:hypothetical protein
MNTWVILERTIVVKHLSWNYTDMLKNLPIKDE